MAGSNSHALVIDRVKRRGNLTEVMTMKRRRFIIRAGGVLVAAGAVAAVEAPNIIAQPKVQWRMSTAYPPALDMHQAVAERFAKAVEETSGGRFRIEVFPACWIMRPLDRFVMGPRRQRPSPGRAA